MTNEEKLNTVVTAYKAGGCGFDEVYTAYIKIYETQYDKIAAIHELDRHDVQAGYEDTLLKVLADFNPSKGIFAHYLKRSLRNKVTDLQREKSRRNKETCYSTLPGGDVEEKNPFYVIESEQNVEEEVLNKKIGDKQRTLIADLVNAANVNPAMRNVFREIMAGCTVHSAAKHFGICHKTVKRRMGRLVECYDVHKYGDIKDYLTA